MSKIPCMDCGSALDAREMLACGQCGAAVCADCAARQNGLCADCGGQEERPAAD